MKKPMFKKLGSNIFQIIGNAISILLGLLFLLSGIGKLGMISQFAETICSIVSMPYAVCLCGALLLITNEIVGGLCLILRWKLKIVVAEMILLVGVFIFVLIHAVVSNHEIICNCFGIFNLNLENTHELLLDVIILDLFILIMVLQSNVVERIKKINPLFRASVPLILALILFFEFRYILNVRPENNNIKMSVSELVKNDTTIAKIAKAIELTPHAQIAGSKDSNSHVEENTSHKKQKTMHSSVELKDFSSQVSQKEETEQSPVIKFISQRLSSFKTGVSGNKILLLMDFSSFSCGTCLKDFVTLSKEAKIIVDKNNISRVAALFRRNPNIDSTNEFNKWLGENGVQCPCYIMPDSMSELIPYQKSLILVLDSTNQILYTKQFPLGEYFRKEVMNYFKND